MIGQSLDGVTQRRVREGMTSVMTEGIRPASSAGAGAEPELAKQARRKWWAGWLTWERWKPVLLYRWAELGLVLGIGATLAWDRYLMCRDFNFKYTDEDQAAIWYAAYDLLRGRIREPAFFGQDY